MQDPKYLGEKKVAEITGMALSTLRNNRHHRKGIKYAKIGKSVRYSFDDVINFMEARKIIFEESKETAK